MDRYYRLKLVDTDGRRLKVVLSRTAKVVAGKKLDKVIKALAEIGWTGARVERSNVVSVKV